MIALAMTRSFRSGIGGQMKCSCRCLFRLGMAAMVGLLFYGFSRTARSDDGDIPTRKLIVGTRNVPPFSVKRNNGEWDGIGIELWKQAAGELRLDYEFREYSLKELLLATENGEVDVAVAGITMTSDREGLVDFSHPFVTSGLGVAMRNPRGKSWFRIVIGATVLPALALCGMIVALNFLAGIAIWLIERHRNPDHFGGGRWAGIGSGFWWAAVTMTTVGYGDKSPRTLPGRVFALIWMFSGVIVMSITIGIIASNLTVNRLQPQVQGLAGLARLRTATVAGTTSEVFLEREGIAATTYPDIREALDDLQSGKIDAVVFDRPTLRYLVLHEFEHDLFVLPNQFSRQNYAMAFPPRSLVREPVNRKLLEITSRQSWDDVERRYLGQ